MEKVQLSNIEVIGLGALNVDRICQVERILGDGEKAAGREPSYSEAELKCIGNFPGGSAANTTYGLAKLGIRTGFIGVVGDDAEGEILLQDFQKVGVDISQIKVKPEAKTGSALCLSDKLNFRQILVSPGTANSLLAANDIDLDYLDQAEVLHVSSFVDEAQLEVLLEVMHRLDFPVKISFSPGELYAAKGLETLKSILTKTHVLFVNEKEIEHLTGDDFNSGARHCLDLGCHLVVVTLGQGASYKTVIATSYIRTAEREYVVELGDKSIISALDTIGAGDAFATGFLYGLLNDKDIEECGRLGNIVAQFSITKVGAREGLPTSAELAQRYQELYATHL